MNIWMTSIKALTVCFAIMLATSCGQEAGGLPEINGIKGPYFNVVNGQLLVTLKLLNVDYDTGMKVSIPETQNSALEFAPNVEDGGMMLVLYLDPEDLASVDIGIGDGNTLPDGRALPGIPGGTLENSLRVDTEYKDISFYFHKKLFGLWIPFGFETAGISGYWSMRFNEKKIGMLGLVGNDTANGYSAGGVILFNLENIKNQQLKKLLEKSRRNPHRIY